LSGVHSVIKCDFSVSVPVVYKRRSERPVHEGFIGVSYHVYTDGRIRNSRFKNVDSPTEVSWRIANPVDKNMPIKIAPSLRVIAVIPETITSSHQKYPVAVVLRTEPDTSIADPMDVNLKREIRQIKRKACVGVGRITAGKSGIINAI
jgi:hypothetical protein